MRPTGAPTEQIVLDLLLEDRVPVEGGNESMAPSDLASSSVSQYGTHLGFKFTTTAIVLFFFATAETFQFDKLSKPLNNLLAHIHQMAEQSKSMI